MTRVNGVNHIAIVVSDMSESLRLYRDILGLPIVSTMGASQPRAWEQSSGDRLKNMPSRLYNLDMGGGILLTLVELPDALVLGRSSFANELWPGDRAITPLGGTDHVSMSVESEADLIEIHARLIEGGFEVSDIESLEVYPFWKQLRFYDTIGNALEISTWDYGDARWPERRERIERESLLLGDPDPV